MKKTAVLSLALWTAAFTLPLIVYGATGPGQTHELLQPMPTVTQSIFTTVPHQTNIITEPPAEDPDEDLTPEMIVVMIDGVRTQCALEDAVAMIVAAEMPALFPLEALKAQAVAARTYILYRNASPSSAHPGAAICDDPTHCCALADLAMLVSGWGDNGHSYLQRILNAVADTAGQIVTYESAPALTMFHAMSGPKTDSALDIFGGYIPYLINVDAPKGESELLRYTESLLVEKEDFRNAFLAKYPLAVLGDEASWFSNFKRSPAGTVLEVKVGGVSVAGMEIRFMCGLRSANFTVTQGGGRLLFETKGYGHGVGMSQNGAKVLALEGVGYAQILAHYYPGTKLLVP